jgi:protein TonB
MFQQTFLDTGQNTKKPVTVVFSLLLQICALCVLALLPLVYTQALPNAQLRSMLAAPAPPRTASPKPPIETKARRVTAIRAFSAKLVAPVVIPRGVNDVHVVAAPPDLPTISGGTEPEGTTDTVTSGLIGSISVPAPPAPKPNATTNRVKVATGVAEANLIRKVMPTYPSLAKAARIQGTVEFTAIINKEGAIENLQLLRGHQLLVQAAKEAVLQWRYRPTLLNGQPVEVVTDIVVNFKLAQ